MERLNTDGSAGWEGTFAGFDGGTIGAGSDMSNRSPRAAVLAAGRAVLADIVVGGDEDFVIGAGLDA